MQRLSVVLSFVAVSLLVRLATAENADPCQGAEPFDARVHLTLESTSVDQKRGFVGSFSLENVDFSPDIVIPGRQRQSTFLVGRPEVTVEFMDLAGMWTSLPMLPGDFLPRPDRLVVRKGRSAHFEAFLMPREIANRSGSDFRILVRLSQAALCIVSAPFHATPVRQEVQGFSTD